MNTLSRLSLTQLAYNLFPRVGHSGSFTLKCRGRIQGILDHGIQIWIAWRVKLLLSPVFAQDLNGLTFLPLKTVG